MTKSLFINATHRPRYAEGHCSSSAWAKIVLPLVMTEPKSYLMLWLTVQMNCHTCWGGLPILCFYFPMTCILRCYKKNLSDYCIHPKRWSLCLAKKGLVPFIIKQTPRGCRSDQLQYMMETSDRRSGKTTQFHLWFMIYVNSGINKWICFAHKPFIKPTKPA